MKHQVLILINFREPDDPLIPFPGFVKNCTTNEEVLAILASCAEYGHDAEVKTLNDDEPWPTLMERLEE